MSNTQDKIEELSRKLEQLLSKQEFFAKELMQLYKEIDHLKKFGLPEEEKTASPPPMEEAITTKETSAIPTPSKEENVVKEEIPLATPEAVAQKTPSAQAPKVKSSLEKFIGENLINKIGIIITIIGVAIGAKYSIENELISPLTRIILGYIAGIVLLGVGIKLKTKYKNYSAVLVSGAMAIMYFITFSGYSFYALFPQSIAFALMVIFTVFTVVAALHYDKQVIAIIGLVGAYAVPFFLSDGSGQVIVLFSYMAIINIGILIISFKKYWKPLYFVAFALTWLIYFSWYALSYRREEHFSIALVFLGLFFILFYLNFIAYKLKKKEPFGSSDIVLLLCNAFIFYGIGYGILNDHETGEQLLGIFTLGNAIIHFAFSAVIYKQKLGDKSLFYMVSGLVLVFITIAIPVQLDGNWVTMLWVGEAALLFWIGRDKGIPVYEKLAYPLIVLAFLSLLQDWGGGYFNDSDYTFTPILNRGFLTATLFLAAFGIILWQQRRTATVLKSQTWNNWFTLLTPAIFLFVLYSSFFIEIDRYWIQQYDNAILDLGSSETIYSQQNTNLLDIKSMWLIIYTVVFFALLSFINIKVFKNDRLGRFNLLLNGLGILIFLVGGLYTLSELRQHYINRASYEYFEIGIFNIVIRYISFLALGALFVVSHWYTQQEFMRRRFRLLFEMVLHITILWVLSSELLHWMDLANSDQSYKLGLSILWGLYAVMLIVLGIWNKKQYLRISAMILFAITLIKLFVYDIASSSTLSKTIVFVALGILLLIISFLYNKYKNLISEEHEDDIK
ncbi:DUF2339 domain-containing protein [Spongiimicrobium salis]|uniref:DUF2339 domain-containing protein n=1 Tax=Spongiimicrobium salis TaxID=1667022 RepID=UPI00374D567E